MTNRMEWQPIETAPNDGVFLVYMPTARDGDRVHTAKWKSNVKIIGGLMSFDREAVTHWMPLPEPPTRISEV